MKLTKEQAEKLSEAIRTIVTLCPPHEDWDKPHPHINFGTTRHTDELIREIIRKIMYGTIGSKEYITVCGGGFDVPDEDFMKLGNAISEWSHFVFWGDGG